MQKLSLFETPLWISQLDLNIEELKKSVLEFSKTSPCMDRSNNGGYQGHGFIDETLFSEIKQNIPIVDDNPIEDFDIFSWVNINSKNHSNHRHCHLDTTIFLSGVYYISVPENSGHIRFYDPRGHLIRYYKDSAYYYGGFSYQYITPEPNMILLFPSWLEHDVETSNAEEDRISIAFNIFNK